MSETKTIQAVELVRRIRDGHARQLAGKSDDEIIAFFRRAGETERRASQVRESEIRLNEKA
jgi:hypothetical protein